MLYYHFYVADLLLFFYIKKMLLTSLLSIPLLGVFAILVTKDTTHNNYINNFSKDNNNNSYSLTNVKFIGLTTSIINLFISLIIFIIFDFSTNQFQFVQEYHEISYFDFYLGVDGISIYFILLTTIIIPISLLSNWTSISKDVESYVIILLLLETLLLAVFLVLDILLFYIFFESILPPLFILIGIFGSDNRVKASFYLFLYTLFGSLFLLLSILAMSSIMSTTDFDTLFKGNFVYITQLFLFYGIFIAFAVKTPTIFLNTWLLKAHVESPLGGSIILAAIVLKLSLYGILRLILPVLPKAYMEYTYIIYLIGVITIIYASLSTLRTIDVKELIAYSSVSHAAVYLLGVFSNSIQGIEGGINLGLAHGLVSPGLFICAGGILYDRTHTRLIAFYRGVAQIMPLFAIFFFILCLSNCGAPLSLNFIGEFLSLYGVFERSSLFGVFSSSSIVFSAAYTMYMYQKISFGGAFSRAFTTNLPDLNKREYTVLVTLVVPTVVFGIYPAPILDAIHYSVSTLIYSFDINTIICDAPRAWGLYLQDNASHFILTFSFIFTLLLCVTLLGFKEQGLKFFSLFAKRKLTRLVYLAPIGLKNESINSTDFGIETIVSYVSNTSPTGWIVFILVVVVLVGFIHLLTILNPNLWFMKKPAATNTTDTSNTDRPSPCRHSIVDRKQLQLVDFNAYKNTTCKNGFKAMDNPNDRSGSHCLNCNSIFCGNPGCGCKP
jgi:NADH-ubiquinone oxidoreductase chain 4